MIAVRLPLKTPNPLNGSHGHWSKKAKLRATQRGLALLVLRPLVAAVRSARVTVTLTRRAPSRGLDPHDGLGASLKGVIDGIADALGLDDRDPRITWVLKQQRAPWGVDVTIETGGHHVDQ